MNEKLTFLFLILIISPISILFISSDVSSQQINSEEPVVEIIFDKDEYFVDLWELKNVTLVVSGHINITWPDDLEWINFSIRSGGTKFPFDGDNIDDFPGNVSYNQTMIPFSISLNVTENMGFDLFIRASGSYEYPDPVFGTWKESLSKSCDITRIRHGVLNIEMLEDEATARPGRGGSFNFNLKAEGTIPFYCRLIWMNEAMLNGSGIHIVFKDRFGTDLAFKDNIFYASDTTYIRLDAHTSNNTEEGIYQIIVGVEVKNDNGEFELVDQFTREYTLTVKERNNGFESSHGPIIVVLSLLILATIIYIIYTRRNKNNEK